MMDFLRCMGFVLGVGTAIFLVAFCIAYPLEYAMCQAQTEDFESRFGIFEGCQVRINDKWVQWDQYRPTESVEES